VLESLTYARLKRDGLEQQLPDQRADLAPAIGPRRMIDRTVRRRRVADRGRLTRPGHAADRQDNYRAVVRVGRRRRRLDNRSMAQTRPAAGRVVLAWPIIADGRFWQAAATAARSSLGTASTALAPGHRFEEARIRADQYRADDHNDHSGANHHVPPAPENGQWSTPCLL
jgi:hypothetical protein